MGNMGHCRFENTYSDLEDCYDHIDEKELSEDESDYRRRLIKLCVDIAVDYGEEFDD